MSPLRYLAVLCGATLVVLALVAAFNVAVDPYAVYGSPRVERFNARKPAASNFTALAKAHQIEAVTPRTVLLGTSRVDIGFDPDHKDWPAADRPVYNYGVPEASILTLESQLRHAVRAGPVRRALVGLEFHDFLRARIDPARPLSEIDRRFVALGEGGAGRTLQLARDRFDAAVTLRALLDSGYTVAAQLTPRSGDLGRLGLTSEAPYAALAAKDGMHLLFRQKDLQILQARRHAARVLAGRPAEDFAEMALLRSLLQYAQSQGIALDLVIPPYHAHYYEIVDATGLWPRFEAWKAALVQVVDEHRRRAGAVRVTLWDFASYDPYTTEPVPREGDRRALMQWFWEPVHFRKPLGDLMLARMLGGDATAFGVELTPQTLAARLEEGRAQRTAYRARQAPERFDLTRLVSTGTLAADTLPPN